MHSYAIDYLQISKLHCFLPERFEPCAPRSECATPASIAQKGPCHHLEAGPALEIDNVAYPHVLTKKAFAPLPQSLRSRADNAAVTFNASTALLHISRNSTASSPARFVFVVGLEGTGHHLLGQYFQACAHEIDTQHSQFNVRPNAGNLVSVKTPASEHRRPFCRSFPNYKLWGGGFDSGLMGSRQAPLHQDPAAATNAPHMTALALETISMNLPETINALVQEAAAPEATYRC